MVMSKKIFDNLKNAPKFFLRNLIIFLNYLKILLNAKINDKLFEDPIIKLDVSLIIGYLVNKYGSKIVESIDFFPLCIKELENKYKIKNENCITKYDDEIRKKAKDTLEDLQYTKKQNFTIFLNSLMEFYSNSKDYENIEKIKNITHVFTIDINNMSMNDLNNKYFNNNKYKDYIEYYIEKILSLNGYIKKKNENENEIYNEKKNELKNHLFFSDILNIDLNNIDDCILFVIFSIVCL